MKKCYLISCIQSPQLVFIYFFGDASASCSPQVIPLKYSPINRTSHEDLLCVTHCESKDYRVSGAIQKHLRTYVYICLIIYLLFCALLYRLTRIGLLKLVTELLRHGGHEHCECCHSAIDDIVTSMASMSIALDLTKSKPKLRSIFRRSLY